MTEKNKYSFQVDISLSLKAEYNVKKIMDQVENKKITFVCEVEAKDAHEAKRKAMREARKKVMNMFPNHRVLKYDYYTRHNTYQNNQGYNRKYMGKNLFIQLPMLDKAFYESRFIVHIKSLH